MPTTGLRNTPRGSSKETDMATWMLIVTTGVLLVGLVAWRMRVANGTLDRILAEENERAAFEGWAFVRAAVPTQVSTPAAVPTHALRRSA